MANYRNSIGWAALQAQADFEKQQAVASQQQQMAHEATRAQAAQNDIAAMDRASKAQQDDFARDMELAKFAGEAAGVSGEAPPKFDNERMGLAAEIASKYTKGKNAFQMQLEKKRQEDDLLRAGLREREIDARISRSAEESARKKFDAETAGLVDKMAWKLVGAHTMEDIQAARKDPNKFAAWEKARQQLQAEHDASRAAGATRINTGDYTDPERKVRGDMQTELVMLDTMLPQFDRIRKAADPKLFGGVGMARNIGTSIANVMNFAPTPEFAKQHAQAKAALQSEAGILVGTVLKALSGLAASEPEAARIYRMALGVRTDENGNLDLSTANIQQMQAALDAYEDYMLRRRDSIRRNVPGIYIGEGEDPRAKTNPDTTSDDDIDRAIEEAE